MFLQEVHSTVYDEKRWQDEFKGELFFSQGLQLLRSGYCFLRNMNFNVLNKIQDNDGRI